MPIEVFGILFGFVSILLYGNVLTKIMENGELNVAQYVGSIVTGLCATLPFINEDIDFIVYLWIGFYVVILVGSLFSYYFENREN